MTSPSGGTTTDWIFRAALEDAFNAGNEFAHHGSRHAQDFDDWYERTHPLHATPDTAPAPYTEPREGDRLLIERPPVEVVVRINAAGVAFCDGRDGTAYLDCDSFARARTEGRVRLVKAAAPTYEPGVYWSPSLGRNFVYVPGLSSPPFIDTFDGSRVAAADLHDLRPCDLVPREAT